MSEDLNASVLEKDLKRATAEAASCARLFAGFAVEQKPEPADLAEAAQELYEKVGRVVAFARIASGRAA